MRQCDKHLRPNCRKLRKIRGKYMEKVERIIQDKFKNIRDYFDGEKRKVFLITLFGALIVHFQVYALVLVNQDALIYSMVHGALGEMELLRFGLYFMQAIKGSIVSPIIATIISCIFLGLNSVFVIDTLEIKNKWLKYITAIVLAVAPNIALTLTFFYCSDAYLLGMLLATLAAFLVRKYQDKKWIILVSGLLIAISMGMYQTYLAVTMVLCIATLIIDTLNKISIKKVGINLLRYLCMGICGIVLYYIISHLFLKIYGMEVSSYSGANTIGLHTLLQLPELLPDAYKSTLKYFFTDWIIQNSVWHTNLLYLIIFVTISISTIYIVIKNKVYERKINVVVSIILALIAPVCFGVIEIMVPDVNIHLLMACAMIYVFPIFFKILEMLPKDSISKVLKGIVVFCSVWIIWNYILQDNASYIALKTQQDQAKSLGTRIVTQIEALDEYKENTPILFVGDMNSNKYLNKQVHGTTDGYALYKKTWGFVENLPMIWAGNVGSWRMLLYQYIGVNANYVISEGEGKEIMETEEFKNMKAYPEKESTKMIDGVVVVKLS